MPRLTKITTRQGDEGYTSLANQKLSKDEPLVEAVGKLDELNAFIGAVVETAPKDKKFQAILEQVQQDLFDMGGELHAPEKIVITDKKILALEKTLTAWNEELPPLKEFVLPRGNIACVNAHIARTVCRAAERSLVLVHRREMLPNPLMLTYLNRLSDLLFILARQLAKTTHADEILWENK